MGSAGVGYDTIIGSLQHPCDLHVLLFFSRFPRVLLTNERLAQYVGYDVQQVAKSVDRLIGSAILSRSQNPNHEAILYVFTPSHSQEWIQQVVSTASTQEGRTRLIQSLKDLQLRRKAQRTRKRGGSGGAPSGSSECNDFARKDSETIQWLTRIS
jgi:DNA-binding MarR family transcriptional regulator